MATINASKGPGSRREVGDEVLARAKAVNTTAVKAQLGAFAKAHAAFLRADALVNAADKAARAAQAKVGEADAEHDALVERLAGAAIGDGAKRAAPFAAWNAPVPSDLKQGAAGPSAKKSRALASAIGKSKTAGKATKSAALALDKAAASVIAQLPIADAAVKKRREAIAGRDALDAAWEKSLAVLRRAAKAASDDPKSAGLFDALFVITGSSVKPKRAPKPTPPIPTT